MAANNIGPARSRSDPGLLIPAGLSPCQEFDGPSGCCIIVQFQGGAPGDPFDTKQQAR